MKKVQQKRPRIGFTTEIITNPNRTGLINVGQSVHYPRAIIKAGGEPVFIPMVEDDESRAVVDVIMQNLDGLILPGGVDIDPANYGEKRGAHTQKPDPVKDTTDKHAISLATELKLPVLAICRGLQLINALKGGKLHQDIKTELGTVVDHDHKFGETEKEHLHDVKVDGDTKLGSILLSGQNHGNSEPFFIKTNSFHHQGIKLLAPGLTPVAWAADGLIEAYEYKDSHRWIWAVQWHPEFTGRQSAVSSHGVTLLEAFVKECQPG